VYTRSIPSGAVAVKVDTRRRLVSAEECQDFLVATANDLPSMMTKYGEGRWLPHFKAEDLPDYEALLRLSYEALNGYHWANAKLPLSQPPKDLTRFYAMIFTHKLRLVWHRALGLASMGEDPQAAVMRLIMDTRSFQQVRRLVGISISPSAAPWCSRSLDALDWLYRNTDKLRRCVIAGCRIYPYFIVSPAHKTYCSDTCKELAEMARVDERVKEQAAARKAKGRTSRISPEGSENISKRQKARWAENRKDEKKSVE
jgi:hypothetical protein